MKPQEAVSILMLSPCYWRMKISERRDLLKEFLASYSSVIVTLSLSANKRKNVNLNINVS